MTEPTDRGLRARRTALVVMLALFAIVALPATGWAIPPPHIVSISATHGIAGTPLTIRGYGFGATGQVIFDPGGSASFSSWSDTEIVCTVPTPATFGPATIMVGTLVPGTPPSNEFPFVIEGPIWITGLSPSHAAPGATITVNGRGFGATQGTSYLTFKYTALGAPGTIVSWSDTQIRFTVANLDTGHHSLGAGIWMGASWLYTNYVPLNVDPKITGISPTRAHAKTTITISGSGFGAVRGTSQVLFNKKAATSYVSWSDTQVKVKVPGVTASFPAGQKTVKVRTPQGTSAGKGFRVL
jgi:hypothetical protein